MKKDASGRGGASAGEGESSTSKNSIIVLSSSGSPDNTDLSSDMNQNGTNAGSAKSFGLFSSASVFLTVSKKTKKGAPGSNERNYQIYGEDVKGDKLIGKTPAMIPKTSMNSESLPSMASKSLASSLPKLISSITSIGSASSAAAFNAIVSEVHKRVSSPRDLRIIILFAIWVFQLVSYAVATCLTIRFPEHSELVGFVFVLVEEFTMGMDVKGFLGPVTVKEKKGSAKEKKSTKEKSTSQSTTATKKPLPPLLSRLRSCFCPTVDINIHPSLQRLQKRRGFRRRRTTLPVPVPFPPLNLHQLPVPSLSGYTNSHLLRRRQDLHYSVGFFG